MWSECSENFCHGHKELDERRDSMSGDSWQQAEKLVHMGTEENYTNHKDFASF